ncbi:MAG: hypothetical protein KAT48_11325, partial [Bacteroidales bacterium]|nr:hypothetical protein [Bacteroidales bacterium]
GLDHTTIKITVPGFWLHEVSTSNGIKYKIGLENTTPLLLPQNPDLVKMVGSIIIPATSEMTYNIVSSQYLDFPDMEIAPSKGNLPKDIDPQWVDYTFSDVYSKDEFFPGKLADLSSPYIIRNNRGLSVNFYPFQYNPVTKTLRVYYNLTVEIVKNGTTGTNTLLNRDGMNSSACYDELYAHHFLNYTPPDRSGAAISPDNMLIVSYGPFMEELSPFIDWKIMKGINTEIVDVGSIGNASAIKSFVQNYYDTNGLTYLLLVGDAELVPSVNTEIGLSDNTYGYVAGNDHYPDIFVGRFSAENIEHVRIQVEKSIEYEKNPELNTNWISKNLGIASDLGPGDDNEFDFEHIRKIQSLLLENEYEVAQEFFDGNQGNNDASGNPTASMVQKNINNGVGSIFYTGIGATTYWATSGFSNNDVGQLSNIDMHPFIISAGCYSGSFDNDETCFAESWMRASYAGKPTGAVAVLMATGRLSWFPPMHAQDVMSEILTNKETESIFKTFGGVTMSGCMSMNDKYGSGGYSVTDIWNIFGDPSLMVRTSTPNKISASHQEIISDEAASLIVECDALGGFVALTSNNEIIGIASITGHQTNVPISKKINGEFLTVVISGFNCVPYIEKIPVVNYPTYVMNPSPKNYSRMVSPTTPLEWQKGHGATPSYYKIYLGTDNPPTNIINGLQIIDTLFKNHQAFESNATYYWRIDAYNEAGMSAGKTWQFNIIDPPDEDFEGIDFPRNIWSFEGNDGWLIDNLVYYNGFHSSRSGFVKSNEYSSIIFNYHVEADDFLSFQMKVSSEEGCDKLQFILDDEILGEWSGEIDWQMVYFPIPKGIHKMEWKYVKDGINESGNDCAWLDDIYLPLNGKVLATAGNNGTVCEGQPYQLSGYAENYCFTEWATAGDGSFEDKNDLFSSYLPGNNDIENGNVTINLLAFNHFAQVKVEDMMQIDLSLLPVIDLPADTILFSNESIVLDAYNSTAVNYLWLPVEAYGPMLTINGSDYEVGNYEFTVVVTNENGCKNKETISITFEEISDKEIAFISYDIFPNPGNGQFNIDLTTKGKDIITNRLYNSFGKLIYESGNIPVIDTYYEKLDFTFLPKGVYYFLTEGLTTASGKKIIIQ